MRLQTQTNRTKVVESGWTYGHNERASSDPSDYSVYRHIFDSDDVALVLTNAKGNVIDVNAEFEKITGYERAELVGRSAFSLARLLTRKGPLLWLRNPMKRIGTAGHSSGEIDVYKKTGEPVAVELEFSRLLKKDGAVLGRLVAITAKTNFQIRGQEENGSGEVHRSLVDHVAIGIFRATPGVEGRFLEVNPAMEEITGYSREELLRMNVAELYVHPEERIQVVRRLLSREFTGSWETLFRKKDGTVISVRDQKAVVTAADGRAVYLEGFLEDTTERRRTEVALQAERENFRNSTEMSPLGIQIVTYDGALVYVNPTMLRMWGYESLEELKEVPIEQRYTPETVASIGEINEERRRGITTSPHEVTMVCKDGHLRVLAAYCNDILWNGGRCVEVLYEDVTERKKAEESLLAERQNYLTSIETSPLGIVIVTHEGKLVYANRALLDIWGYDSFEELRLVPPEARFGPDSASWIRGLKERLTHGEEVGEYHREAVAVRKDGQLRNVLARRRAVLWDGKQCAQVLYEDITERKKADARLAEVTSHQEVILAAVPDIIMEVNNNNLYTWANQAGLDFFGNDVVGKSAEYYFEGEQDTYDRVQPAFRGDVETVYVESWQRRRDGEKRLLAWWCRSLKDSQGTVIGALSAAQDVTERRAAEEALKESELKLNEAQAAGKIGHWEYDLASRRIVWSSEMYNLYERDSALGPFSAEEEASLFSPQQVAHLTELRRHAINSHEVVPYDLRASLPSGKTVHLAATMRAIRDLDGRAVRLFGTAQDITDRKEAELALASEKENFRNAMEMSLFGIEIVSLSGELVYANHTLLDLWGYSTFEELKSTPMEQRFASDSVSIVKGRIERRERGEALSAYEVKIICKDGTKRDLRAHGREIVWNGKSQIQISYEDVTERKKMQEQLISQDRLASIGELVSGVAHEINNPLTGVIGFSQLLMEQDMPAEARENLDIIWSQAQRAATIVKNLLTFARKHAPVKQSSQINDIIEDVLKLRAYEQRVNNIEVLSQLAPDLPEIMADYFQMQQVFLNIVINAEYFMIEAHKRGTLTIATSRVDGVIRTSITDDGPGIPGEVLTNIFDPFFTTKGVGKGTGLGLSICHGIVTEHDGRIYAESKEGTGATFVVELPLEK